MATTEAPKSLKSQFHLRALTEGESRAIIGPRRKRLRYILVGRIIMIGEKRRGRSVESLDLEGLKGIIRGSIKC